MTWQSQNRQCAPPPGTHTAFTTRAPPPPVPQYVPVPQQGPSYAPQRVPQKIYQARNTNQGRGRGRNRMGRGRGINRRTYGPRPPTAGRVQHNGQPLNTTKYYNNWNYCFSCGFDVPDWHTSETCPPECRKIGHQDGCTRQNVQTYIVAGHDASLKKQHKVNLPT